MKNTQLKPTRNLSMEFCKLIAAVFVILIHVPLPGKLGGFTRCLARFAVPMFFAISGWFSCRADCEKLAGRIKHIFKLNVAATLLYAVWGCCRAVCYGDSAAAYLRASLNTASLMKWLLLQQNPFAGHLWYLTAIFLCYLVLWAYVRFSDEKKVNYQPLYIVGACLLPVCLACGELAAAVDVEIPYVLYRNAWFLGLPMFAMGIFLREYQERIVGKFHLTTARLTVLIFAGVLISVMQWWGVGIGELPIGMVLAVPALLLLMAAHPNIAGRSRMLARIVSSFGSLSTTIYVVHLMLSEIYAMLSWRFDQTLTAAEQEIWAAIAVICGSLAVSVLWEGIFRQRRKAVSS